MPDPAAASSSQDTCPLCGGPNDCGLAAGAETCWCFSASIPRAALEPIPVEARDRTCICAACAGQTSPGSASPVES